MIYLGDWTCSEVFVSLGPSVLIGRNKGSDKNKQRNLEGEKKKNEKWKKKAKRKRDERK